jgi:uridine phosphorylase
MKHLAESELIVNEDGSIYHLHLKPEHIAKDIIVVGDPQRVALISSKFDSIEHQIVNREFVTHTGTLHGKRITALATGIGTDNIDIVLNELDALVNIDLSTRSIKEKRESLNIIRIGTSGALQADLPVDSFVMSSHGIGMDGLLNFYEAHDSVISKDLTEEFIRQSAYPNQLARPYIVAGSASLKHRLGEGLIEGITATASGFYAPQGRALRLKPAIPQMNELLRDFSYQDLRITNFEMETSALYGLGRMLGHETLTVCAIIANRYSQTFSKDYKATVNKLIDLVLERLTK